MTEPLQVITLDIEPPERTPGQRAATDEKGKELGNKLYPSPHAPTEVADYISDSSFKVEDKSTLLYWRGDWWIYTGTHWDKYSDEEIGALLYRELKSAQYEKGEDEDGKPIPTNWNPTRAKIGDTLAALKADAMLRGNKRMDAPYWMLESGPVKADAGNYIAFPNGLYNFKTDTLCLHDARIFNTWALPYNYAPNAECPYWEKFMDDVFEHDENGKLSLQEFFGYVISGRTDFQKAFLIIGPPGSGKTTIVNVLKQLIGIMNVAPIDLPQLADDFGLAHLIGMPLATVGDAGADDKRRLNSITSVMKNIIGEDSIAINRKNQDFWTGQLPTRFMIASNTAPRFLDASGAIVERFISVELIKGHRREGTEDKSLPEKFTNELPGIFNWAMEGLKRLEKQDKFTIPDTMQGVKESLESLSALHKEFILENYEVTENPEDEILLSEVHRNYKAWCIDKGYSPKGQNPFYEDIRSAHMGVKATQTSPDANGKRKECFRGIKPLKW